MLPWISSHNQRASRSYLRWVPNNSARPGTTIRTGLQEAAELTTTVFATGPRRRLASRFFPASAALMTELSSSRQQPWCGLLISSRAWVFSRDRLPDETGEKENRAREKVGLDLHGLVGPPALLVVPQSGKAACLAPLCVRCSSVAAAQQQRIIGGCSPLESHAEAAAVFRPWYCPVLGAKDICAFVAASWLPDPRTSVV
jgi:hypothetical protein